MIGYIYQIENLVTHESYIGQTIDFKRRKRDHINNLKNNQHDNPKLQNAWNKYGEQEFHFRVWEFNIESSKELNKLECEYIKKYDSLNNGYNLVPGGGKPPLHQKVKDEDIVKFLCVQFKYGDGLGKTCEDIFGWARGTASAAKRKVRFLNAWNIYEKMTKEEQDNLAEKVCSKYHMEEKRFQRQLAQGGCSKAYSLTQDDYNFAFTAQELGYGYTSVAEYLQIRPSTVKDWFNGRSRKKEREQFNKLSEDEKSQLIGRVKIAELSGKPKSISSI